LCYTRFQGGLFSVRKKTAKKPTHWIQAWLGEIINRCKAVKPLKAIPGNQLSRLVRKGQGRHRWHASDCNRG